MQKKAQELKLILLFIVFFFTYNLFPQPNTNFQYIGKYNDYPYSFINGEGKPDGFSIDLIEVIGKVMNFDVKVKLESSVQLNNDILYGNNFDISAVFYSENREQSVEFSAPVLFSEAEIYIRKETKKIN